MKVVQLGHRYELANADKGAQMLQFIEKRVESVSSNNLVTIQDGTTNEEVLAVLIDRLDTMNKRFPCRENNAALENLELAQMWLGKRTADRVARGVEGTNLK